MQRSAPGIRSLSSQPNCSMPRMAIRCAVSACRPKRRSASRTASAKPAPPGTTSSGWRRPSSPSAAHRPGSASSPTPPPTLTTVSTGVPPAVPRAPLPVPPLRRRPLARGARRPRVPGTRRSPRRRRERRAAHPARRLLDLAHLLAVQERRDRVDLRFVELVDVGAHQPGDPLASELDGGRAAVGRRAVVGLRRWPSTRWTSALIAKSSDATGHQPPRTGTRGAIAARLVRSTPV